jgi:hypothetical protein
MLTLRLKWISDAYILIQIIIHNLQILVHNDHFFDTRRGVFDTYVHFFWYICTLFLIHGGLFSIHQIIRDTSWYTNCAGSTPSDR